MNKTKLTLSVLATFLFIIVCATPSQAITNRTYVAGPGIGNDANAGADCPFSAPCRFFSTAFNQTSAGGEIIALTSGIGYGGMTINKAITITGPVGQGLITVTAGGTGFTVSAGASDLVVVQNLSFNGSGAAGSTGLSHTSGKLVVKNCVFAQLTTGLSVVNAKMDLINSDFFNNGTGVSASGTGTDSQPANPSTTQVRIAFGNIIGNTVGLKQINPVTNFFNIWFFGLGNGQSSTPNVIGNTTGAQACNPGCVTVQNIQSFGANTILP